MIASMVTARSATMAVEGELELSVVIPCLDEERSIGVCVEKAVRALREAGLRGEVVVADNGSADRSVEVATGAGARVVPVPVRGYGAALQAGIAAARGRWVVMGDADDSYDFGELSRFVAPLRDGARLVMGTRLRGEIKPGAMPVLNRRLGTPVLTWILNRLFGTRISDCNCGMRGFDRASFLSLGVVSPGMEFASEMLIRAAIHGLPIAEVPITLHPDKRGRPPHLRPWRDGWRHLRLLLWHAPDHLMTVPGLALLLVGLGLAVWQVWGPFTLGGWLFDFHYMILGLTLSLVGQSALGMGIAVRALSPDRRLRTVRFVDRIARGFSFEAAMGSAGLLLLGGLACDGAVLAHWLATDRGPLTSFYTRLTLVGMLFVALGFQTALLGLMVGSTRSALARSPLDGPPSG